MRHRRTIVLGPLLVSAAAALGRARSATAQPLALTPACDDHGGAPTPPETEGPYFKPRSPERNSLLDPGLIGSRMVLVGRVLATNCQPIVGRIARLLACERHGRLRQRRIPMPGAPVHGCAGRVSARDSGARQLSGPDSAHSREGSSSRRAAAYDTALFPTGAA